MQNLEKIELSDEDLALNFKQGSTASMEIIMEKYKPIIKTIARRYFLQGGDSDDLLQEGMIGLYKSLVSYDEKENSSFKAYAILCIRRQMFSAIKLAGAKKHTALNSASSIDHTDLSMANGKRVEEEFIRQEEQEERLRKVNEKLSLAERKILNLYLEGLSYKEIASQLEVTTKLVDNTLMQIKKKLKK